MQFSPESYHDLHGAAVRGDWNEDVKVRGGCEITHSDSKEGRVTADKEVS